MSYHDAIEVENFSNVLAKGMAIIPEKHRWMVRFREMDEYVATHVELQKVGFWGGKELWSDCANISYHKNPDSPEWVAHDVMTKSHEIAKRAFDKSAEEARIKRIKEMTSQVTALLEAPNVVFELKRCR